MNQRARDLGPADVARLTVDTEPYLSCDDCFEQVDARVEDLLAGRPLTAAFRAHLIGCAACRDEARSLAELAGQDAGVVPEIIGARFEAALAPRPPTG